MNGRCYRSDLAFGLVLSAMLVLAQTAALAHAAEHEPGTAQSQSCALCATAVELQADCVDTALVAALPPGSAHPDAGPERGTQSILTMAVRQRGPPQHS